MKAAKIIAKIVVALAAVAGVVYVVATYGNQIVAWCKKLLASLPCPCCKGEEACACAEAEAVVEEPAEEAAEVVEEAPAVEEAVEEAPAAEETVVAEDADFEA